MKISATINESEFKKTLRQWDKLTGKGVEAGVEQASRSTASKLAATVQPWGTSDAVMSKFAKNVERQVAQTWFGVNLGYFELQGNLEQTHNSLRRRGRVRGRRFRDSHKKRWLYKVSEQDKDNLVRKQVAKVGRAKAAWIKAGVSVNGKRMSGRFSSHIKGNVKNGYGRSRTSGSGFKRIIELDNYTPYIKYIQNASSVTTALRRGRKAALTSFKRAIRHQLKKAQQ